MPLYLLLFIVSLLSIQFSFAENSHSARNPQRNYERFLPQSPYEFRFLKYTLREVWPSCALQKEKLPGASVVPVAEILGNLVFKKEHRPKQSQLIRIPGGAVDVVPLSALSTQNGSELDEQMTNLLGDYAHLRRQLHKQSLFPALIAKLPLYESQSETDLERRVPLEKKFFRSALQERLHLKMIAMNTKSYNYTLKIQAIFAKLDALLPKIRAIEEKTGDVPISLLDKRDKLNKQIDSLRIIRKQIGKTSNALRTLLWSRSHRLALKRRGGQFKEFAQAVEKFIGDHPTMRDQQSARTKLNHLVTQWLNFPGEESVRSWLTSRLLTDQLISMVGQSKYRLVASFTKENDGSLEPRGISLMKLPKGLEKQVPRGMLRIFVDSDSQDLQDERLILNWAKSKGFKRERPRPVKLAYCKYKVDSKEANNLLRSQVTKLYRHYLPTKSITREQEIALTKKALFNHPYPFVRAQAASLFKHYHPIPGYPKRTIIKTLIRAAANDPDDSVRAQAMLTLPRPGKELAREITSLMKVFENEIRRPPSVSSNFIITNDFEVILRRLREEAAPAVPALIRSLKHSRGREVALKGLGYIGPKAEPAAQYVRKYLFDKDRKIRRAAADTLSVIVNQNHKNLVPDLIRALQDPHKDVRIRASWALKKIGAGASHAIEPLERAAKQDPENRRDLLGVVESIRNAVQRREQEQRKQDKLRQSLPSTQLFKKTRRVVSFRS